MRTPCRRRACYESDVHSVEECVRMLFKQIGQTWGELETLACEPPILRESSRRGRDECRERNRHR